MASDSRDALLSVALHLIFTVIMEKLSARHVVCNHNSMQSASAVLIDF